MRVDGMCLLVLGITPTVAWGCYPYICGRGVLSMAISTITLQSATCPLCANRVSVALHAVAGVRNFDVDLSDEIAVITYDDDTVDDAVIRNVIDEVNCDAHKTVH